MQIIKKLKSLWAKPQIENVQEGIRIKLERNQSKLGKRYVAKLYKDGKLIASYPANQISDIDLKFFNPNQ